MKNSAVCSDCHNKIYYVVAATSPKRLASEPPAGEDTAQWQACGGEVGVCSGGRRHPAGERPVRRRRHPAAQHLGAQRPLLHRDR